MQLRKIPQYFKEQPLNRLNSLLKRENKLTWLANKYRSDKGTRKIYFWEGDRHFYSEVYYQYFEPLRQKPINLFEIGIATGPSLKMWYDFFPKADIHALDIKDYTRFNNQRTSCHIGDQSRRDDLERVMSSIGKKFDIIIDDGGHYMEQQQVSFGFLFKYLKPGGLYFIEDLHTSYWPYNGFYAVYDNIPIDINQDRSNTTLKMVKDYLAQKKIQSQYLTPTEIEYLNKKIGRGLLHDTAKNKYGPNHLAVFQKKR